MDPQENGIKNRSNKKNPYSKLKEEQEYNASSHETTKTSGSNRKTIALIFVSLLLDLLAFTMILPLFPSLLDYYNKEEGSKNNFYAVLLKGILSFQQWTGAPDRFVSVLFGGALGSMYSFLQFLTSPIVGSLSDAYGRKPMLIICLVGIALSHALWTCASTFNMFVLARFIGGLSKANVSLSMAIITDASTEKTRPRGMALVGLAFSIGFIAGPLAGAWFSLRADGASGLWGERPAQCALAMALLNIVLVVLCLPETLTKDKRSPASFTLSQTVDFVSPFHLLKFTAIKDMSPRQSKTLSRIGLIYFLYLFIYSGLEFTITFLTHHVFNYTAMQQGKMFLVIGAVMSVLQGGAARRLSARGAVVAARASLWGTPLAFLSVALAATDDPPLMTPLAWLWLGLVLFAMCTAFAVSCVSQVAGAWSPPPSRGAALGTLRSLGALGRAMGPLLAAAMYWSCGAAVTYSLGAALLLIPAAMIQTLRL